MYQEEKKVNYSWTTRIKFLYIFRGRCNGRGFNHYWSYFGREEENVGRCSEIKLSIFLHCQTVFYIVWLFSGLSDCYLHCQTVFYIVRLIPPLSLFSTLSYCFSTLSDYFLLCQSVSYIVRLSSALSECFLHCKAVF